jgi:hypothetical protein
MSHAFTDGVPGLEAIHKWTSGHRLAPTTTLNHLTPSQVSRVKLDNIDGLHGRPEIEDRRQSHLGRHGELIGPAYEPGRTITYTGQIQAKSALELRKREMALNEAFEERLLEGAMQVLIDDQVGTPLDYWIFTGRVISFDPDDQQQHNAQATWPYQRGFTLGIRCSDPRVYWSHAISGGPNASQVTLTNTGRDTNPLISVTTDGSTDFTITNTTITRHLKFQASTLAATKVVTFDFQRRVIWVNDVGDVPFVDGYEYTELLLTAQSDWWDPGVPGIDRGSNQINLTGTGADDLTVYFTPAV